MPLLSENLVGAAAWQRMVRDEVVVTLRPGVGHARGTERSAALRAIALAPAVPRRATLAGAAALWVHGWAAAAPAPALIEVAVPRGCHPDPPPGFSSPWWSFVTDPGVCAASQPIGGVAVTDAAHALATMLATGDLGRAVEGAWWALSTGLVDGATVSAVIGSSARRATRHRAQSAWNTVCAAAGAP